MNDELALALAQEMLAELRAIRAALGKGSQSSVELADNPSKGVVAVTVKTYVDSSPPEDAIVECLGAFATLKSEVRRGDLSGWQATVDMLEARKGAA